MRIGIFTDDFLPRDSGVVTSILQLRRGLVERGHEVFIIAPAVPDYIDTLENIIRLPSLDSVIFRKVRAAIPLPRSTKYIDTLGLDIVHSMTQYNVGLYADYIAARLNIPHVTTAHTIMAELVRYYPRQMTLGLLLYSQLYDYYFGIRPNITIPENTDIGYGGRITEMGLRWVRRQIWSLQNQFLGRTDFVITPSTHALADLQKYGLKKPAAVVPNGIDIKLFHGATKRKIDHRGLHVVTVGRFSGEKRQDALIRAIALTDNVRLSLIGDGPNRGRFERLAEQLGLDENRIIFYGSRDQEFIRDVMAAADVFALASYNFETQGMVLLEAAAAGLPVAYCDKRLTESVSPQSSFYVERFPADFADLFERLLNDKSQLATMRKSAMAFAAGFDYTVFTEKIIDIYDEILEHWPKPVAQR